MIDPRLIAQLDDGALARLFARYDHAGVVAISHAYATYLQATTGVQLAAVLIRGIWQRRGLITPDQAGGELPACTRSDSEEPPCPCTS